MQKIKKYSKGLPVTLVDVVNMPDAPLCSSGGDKQTGIMVQLIIREQVIEQVPVDIKKYPLFENRMARINAIVNYLKWRYHGSMVLVQNWEIVLLIESKMNDVVNIDPENLNRTA